MNSRSSPFIWSVLVFPFAPMIFPRIGFASIRFASVTTSPAKLDVAPLQVPPAQKLLKVAGICCKTLRSKGSGKTDGTTESSTRRSTWLG